MKERPILFSGPMVRAVLGGTKTQTRRVIRPDWVRCLDLEDEEDLTRAFEQCPFGLPGDRLWVRESWQAWSRDTPEADDWTPWSREERRGLSYAECLDEFGMPEVLYRATSTSIGPWNPSIHMPRWASRLSLKVTAIRIERLQSITDEDAIAEGVTLPTGPECPCCSEVEVPGPHLPHCAWRDPEVDPDYFPRHVVEFGILWNKLNAKRGYSWATNPWTWVVEFSRIEQSREQGAA